VHFVMKLVLPLTACGRLWRLVWDSAILTFVLLLVLPVAVVVVVLFLLVLRPTAKRYEASSGFYASRYAGGSMSGARRHDKLIDRVEEAWHNS
jgi:hypothetical protein